MAAKTPWRPRSGVKRKGWMGMTEDEMKRHHSSRRRTHRTRRENDEIACSCGKRWPLGEHHP